MTLYTEIQKQQILDLRKEGFTLRAIASNLGVSKSGVWDYLESVTLNKTDNLSPQKQTIFDIKPNVLLLDIETAPSIAASFNRFKVNISHEAVISEGGWIISYAYKWLGENGVKGSVLTPEEAIQSNDLRLIQEISLLLEEATEVVWHNGDCFDLPIIKTRTILNKLPPIRKIKSIDTLNLVKEFRFNSNKLDSLCKQLEAGRKVKHDGISLWLRCMHGDDEALAEMFKYNVGDIPTLESVYLTVRPYSTRHPNLAVHYGDKIRCNVCCSDDIQETGNKANTNLSVFREYKCNSCGARLKGRKADTTKAQRANFLSN